MLAEYLGGDTWRIILTSGTVIHISTADWAELYEEYTTITPDIGQVSFDKLN